jgi:hypothetical protein
MILESESKEKSVILPFYSRGSSSGSNKLETVRLRRLLLTCFSASNMKYVR